MDRIQSGTTIAGTLDDARPPLPEEAVPGGGGVDPRPVAGHVGSDGRSGEILALTALHRVHILAGMRGCDGPTREILPCREDHEPILPGPLRRDHVGCRDPDLVRLPAQVPQPNARFPFEVETVGSHGAHHVVSQPLAAARSPGSVLGVTAVEPGPALR